ncbi:MAG: prolyl oligopeptidase family serine peptidase [Pseudomonadota bacterium]
MNRLISLALLLLATPGVAQSPGLKQIMADPAWIGAPVESTWWQLDGSAVHYQVQRAGTDVRDWHRIDLATGEDQRLDYADHAQVDGAQVVFHAASGRAVFVRHGNLFLREPGQADARQLTGANSSDAQPGFDASGERIRFRRGNQWWMYDLADGFAAPVADLRFDDDPDAEPNNYLTEMQLRLFSSLSNDAERERISREEARRAAQEDPTRGPAPWYLGKDLSPVWSSLSPDGRWLFLATEPAGFNDGRDGQMPLYVTEDGYVDIETVRTRVGLGQPAPHRLWLLDLAQREVTELDTSVLPGIDEDPLAELKEAQELTPHDEDNPRPLRLNGAQWQPSSDHLAIQLRAIDNKDRWIVTVDLESPELNTRHRLTDPAWINWNFNDFGWIGESDTLWLLSEETGYSHLYRVAADRGRAVALTEGDFEVLEPVWSLDGEQAWVLSNESHPTEYDLYRVNWDGRNWMRLTEHRGIESFTVLPGHDQILLRYSESYLPPQVALVSAEGGEIQALTDTRTEQFEAIDWQAPQIVGVESSHGAGTIWSKFYPARTPAPEGGHPVVLFVHGAGYLQNTWLRYPNYFREQMFHNLLTEAGYHVLDMDFRASEGYGRDWRTTIYRQMGTPELEDLIDGVQWLVDEHGANAERVGLYGGSYGGFMTFMALFNAPEVFQAGAALRPVSDWAHYNHFYTSNILNTPAVDPEAFERSSPIEFAEGLQGHLLMTHGMLDDNVFYQDVVRLAQRLIDLEKDNWELASYPLERHGFQRPGSWRDQYQRIYELFEATIGGE